MGNPFVHVELMSTDVGKAKAFYGKLFDWKLEDMDIGDMTYTMIKVGEGTGGGLMKNPMPNAGSMWVAYVNVDDLKAATAKAKSLGATVIKDQVEVNGRGSSASSRIRPERCWACGSRREGDGRGAHVEEGDGQAHQGSQRPRTARITISPRPAPFLCAYSCTRLKPFDYIGSLLPLKVQPLGPQPHPPSPLWMVGKSLPLCLV